MPAAPKPMPAAQEPMPAAPKPMPAAQEPMPAAPEPMPATMPAIVQNIFDLTRLLNLSTTDCTAFGSIFF